ncbi:unnamed protein product [Cylicocyclus nassatus]|uniref:Uncharacterized protein n=1 Tax=Cylicocyclus nassatus TaxID=53992 RepID=A0AA36M6D7_CYLNA|nr:unnamed protein product [Cylicocyclus nassatus]
MGGVETREFPAFGDERRDEESRETIEEASVGATEETSATANSSGIRQMRTTIDTNGREYRITKREGNRKFVGYPTNEDHNRHEWK